MDVNLHALMMQNVPSIELNRRLLQNEINAHRFAKIISQASHKDPTQEGVDLPSSRLRQSRTANKTVPIHNRSYDAVVNLPPGTDAERPSPPSALTIAQTIHSGEELPALKISHNSRSLSVSQREKSSGSVSTPLGLHSSNLSASKPSSAKIPPGEAPPDASQTAMVPDIASRHLHHSNLVPSPPPQYHIPGAIISHPRGKDKYCPSIPPLLSKYTLMYHHYSHNYR